MKIMSEQVPNFGNKIHAGHVAVLLGIVFWILFALQPYIDPTPENLPTQSHDTLKENQAKTETASKQQKKQRDGNSKHQASKENQAKSSKISTKAIPNRHLFIQLLNCFFTDFL